MRELLDRVMHNYRRFYMNKALFSYPWAGRRRASPLFARLPQGVSEIGIERKFYYLGRVNYRGPQSKGKVKFKFDASRKRAGYG